ncbi:DMT family transporter [Halomarina litorea]|uniref:DMT family transporter n=1 Tax=Halomarina litorea TaxID=2961595 RepID=UPI0020C22D82|nr:EamA family transporter [Halomarina sp. BCD28]
MRERVAALAPLLAAVLWGGLYVVSAWGFEAVPPLTLAFFRMVVASAVLYAVVRATKPRRSFSRREWVSFAALGGWVAVSLATQYLGTALTSAGQGSLVTILTPVATLALGVTVLGESLSVRGAAGMALATVGTFALVLARSGADAGGSLLGSGMLVVASLTFAVYTVYGKPLIRRYSALEAATYATLCSMPLFALFALGEVLFLPGAFDVRVTLPLVAAVGYLGVFGTAAAWYLWYKGMEYTDAGTIAVFFFAQPVVGVALGALLLGEQVGWEFLASGGVMLVGIYLASTAESPESAEPTEGPNTD